MAADRFYQFHWTWRQATTQHVRNHDTHGEAVFLKKQISACLHLTSSEGP